MKILCNVYMLPEEPFKDKKLKNSFVRNYDERIIPPRA